jgi:hypothetical protein
MPYPANAQNFKIGKGGLYVADWTDSATPPDDDDIGLRIGNCENVSIELGDAQVLEKYSSTQNHSPLADQRQLRQVFSVLAALDEHTYRNLEKFFMGNYTSAAQPSASSQMKTIESVKQGNTYAIGAFDVSNVSVQADGTIAAVADTDYVLFPKQGHIYIVPGGAIQDGVDIVVTYNRAARTVHKVAGGTALNRFGKVTFASDDANTDGTTANGVLTVWKARVGPEGAYQLVSAEYSPFSLRLTMLDDSEHHPTEPLFKIEYPASS